jgi:hypothetical protein
MLSFYTFAIDLIKARTHKYIRRVPIGATKTGGTKYMYYYQGQEAHGQGMGHESELVEGSSFAFGEGENRHHVHIKAVNGDKLTIEYDDGDKKGTKETLSKTEFQNRIHKEHASNIQHAKARKEAIKEKKQSKKPAPQPEQRVHTEESILQSLQALLQNKGSDEIQKLLDQLGMQVKPKVDIEKQKARLLLAGEAGKPVRHEAKYKIVEASDLIASHKPTSFGENPAYPKEVQERAYESDKAEQMKVMRNAQNLEPSFLVNTNPDAINGAPIMTPDRIVLGGNSRTMAVQRAYDMHPEKAEEYKNYLASNAHAFGFSSDYVHGFSQPVLVREYEPSDTSKDNLRLLVRQMNEGFTQGMDERTETSAIARRLTKNTLKTIGDEMMASDEDSLSDFLKSGSKGAIKVINALMKDGVISNQNMNKYFDVETQQVNNNFISLLQNVITGTVITDRKVLKKLKPSLYDRFASGIVTLATQGLDDKNKEALQSAIYAYALANSTNFVKTKGNAESNIRGLNDWFKQQSVDMGDQDEENTLKNNVRKNPLAQAYLEALAIGTSAERVKTMFSQLAKKTLTDDATEQVDMFGDTPNILTTLKEINTRYAPKEEGTKQEIRFIAKSMRFSFYATLKKHIKR